MACPDTQKAEFGLYQKFLLKLSPEASAIENATWGLGGTTHKNRVMHFMRNMLSQKFLRALKRKIKQLKRTPDTSKYAECIREQMKNGSTLNSYLSVNALNSLIGNCGKWETATLLTLTSLLEELDTDVNTLAKYREYSFGNNK